MSGHGHDSRQHVGHHNCSSRQHRNHQFRLALQFAQFGANWFVIIRQSTGSNVGNNVAAGGVKFFANDDDICKQSLYCCCRWTSSYSRLFQHLRQRYHHQHNY